MANLGPAELALILGGVLVLVLVVGALGAAVWQTVRPPAKHSRKRRRHR